MGNKEIIQLFDHLKTACHLGLNCGHSVACQLSYIFKHATGLKIMFW